LQRSAMAACAWVARAPSAHGLYVPSQHRTEFDRCEVTDVPQVEERERERDKVSKGKVRVCVRLFRCCSP
jgi:hypothetical protein